MRDRFFLGSAAGITGAAVMSIINFVVNLIPGINMKLLFGASELFIPKSMVGTLPGSTIGLVAHLVCGSLVGLAFLIVLERFGYDYIILKGSILGLFAWFILCGLMGKALKLGMQDKFLDNTLFILIHIPFGITTAWIIKHYRAREKML